MGCLSLSFLYVLLFFIFHSQVSSSSSSSGPQCHPNESTALLQFKDSFLPSHSPNFLITSYSNGTIILEEISWNESTNCCTWSGITCDGVTGHVTGLVLYFGTLKGTISSNSSLFFLHHLQTLVLYHIDFRGSAILPEFGQFKNLTHLELSFSNFWGHLPLEISHLSNLVSLKLYGSYDGLEITIGEDTFKAIAENLTNLRVLELSSIDMSSVPPISLINMSSLTSLSLTFSKLHGELPLNFFQIPKLEVLDLSGDNLTGQIPCSLGTFHLSFNNFSDQLPEVCSNSSQKSPPHGSSKHPVGSIPSTLAVLKLSRNFLSGTIPSWIHELPYLEELDLSYNHFTGEIAEFQSSSLRSLFLDGNKLHGNIPRSIFQHTELTDLHLSSNNLTGTVEFEKLSNLKKLKTIDLSSNNLSFNFNNSINYTFDSLSSLRLSSCNISEFPHFLRYSKGLSRLDLSFNHIQGSVPKWLWEVSKDSMYYLNLSYNSLTNMEPLPWDNLLILDLNSNIFSAHLPISSAPHLLYYIASKNQFSGDIPTSICSMTELEIVDLSYNNLSGLIPQCMGNFSEWLTIIDLRMNKLHGPIPATFETRNTLRNINLNGNQLEGPLPRSLVHCRYLEVLDLGNNQLKDTFPNWLESLPKLQVLVLRANKFYGSIGNPKTKSPFHELRIMDISYNEFRGALPVGYIENFKAMMDAEKVKMEYMMGALQKRYNDYYFYSIVVSMKGLYVELVKIQTILTTIDFSSNNFTGQVPTSIGRLESLKGLNFSHNKLRGFIPSSLGNLTNLEWLDLSSNELVGRIPYQLAGIPWLAFLNLSRNQLVGPIPTGGQFNTFSTDSYSGNPGLCGFPLSKCGSDEAQHNQDDDGDYDDGMFEWKVVILGYGSGTVIGISVGYMVLFSIRGHYWFQKRFGREPRQISIAPLRGRRRN